MLNICKMILGLFGAFRETNIIILYAFFFITMLQVSRSLSMNMRYFKYLFQLEFYFYQPYSVRKCKAKLVKIKIECYRINLADY